MYDPPLNLILDRNESLFSDDIAEHESQLRKAIAGARILVVGAGGSIGSAFVEQLCLRHPAVLHLVDLSENSLVEIVRSIRSSSLTITEDFKTFAIGMGTMEFQSFMEAHGDYSYVFNFAALKHVRSERDPFTLMRMFYTNVFAVRLLLEQLKGRAVKKFFSVSSDKAVAPTSMMGATKAFMERVMLSYANTVPCSTARFANVAFSDGSLLQGFENRLRKRQPLAAPSDVKRYFISREEAGQLCLLAGFLGSNRDVFFPKLDAAHHMRTLSEVACMFLQARGLSPHLCSTEEQAKAMVADPAASSRSWPCVFSESDTAGEKMYEEFYTDKDDVDLSRFSQIGVIHERPLEEAANEIIRSVLNDIMMMRQTGKWNSGALRDAAGLVVPEFRHKGGALNLDQKM